MDGGCAVHKANLHPSIIASTFFLYFLKIIFIGSDNRKRTPNFSEVRPLMNNMKQTAIVCRTNLHEPLLASRLFCFHQLHLRRIPCIISNILHRSVIVRPIHSGKFFNVFSHHALDLRSIFSHEHFKFFVRWLSI